MLVTDKGLVNVHQLKIIPNMKAGTVEEAQERKKATHLTAFKYLLNEIRDELLQIAQDPAVAPRLEVEKKTDLSTVDRLISSIMDECKERLEADAKVGVEEFADDVKFQALVNGMFDVKTMALCKFKWWLIDATKSLRPLSDVKLGTAMRGYIAYLMRRREATDKGNERKQVELEIAKLRGLLQGAIEQRNSGGETALVVAAADGRATDDLLLLIEAGASVNHPTMKAPLAWTAQHGYVESTTLLIQKNAAVNAGRMEGPLSTSRLPTVIWT